MIKEPSLSNQTEVAAYKTDFEQLENLVVAASFPNNNYKDYIDVESLVNYLIVYHLTDNEEINHPKSTYMHKTQGGKYIMGPIWDFDWAYGRESGAYFGSTYTRPLFWSANTSAGTKFFSRFMLDPAIKTIYKQKWTAFKASKLSVLLTFVDEYAALIETSQKADYAIWGRGSGNFKNDVTQLRQWLTNRANQIDSYVSSF
jgi:spore coat protein CotH